MIFDSHTHIQFKAFDEDRTEVIDRAIEHNVLMNVVGTQSSTSKAAVLLAEKHKNIYASVGIHPIQHDVVDVVEETTEFTSRGELWNQELFEELAKHPKVIAIGETGLDRFHIRKDKTIEEIFNKQKELFKKHYDLAKAYTLPLVIHVRDAHEETLAILEALHKQDGDINGTIHCFSGNWQEAQRYLALGLHLGFTGIITFPVKKTNPQVQLDLLEVVEKMPIEKMLLETDAPYLTPQVRRGKRNEPMLVHAVAEKVAEVRNMSVEEVITQTTRNGKKLFNKMV